MAVDGTYKVVAEGLGKKAEGTIVLQEQASQLIGTANLLGQTVALENGKVQGNTVTGTMRAETPMGRLKFNVSATVTGDAIEGTMKALIAKGTFRGTRVG